MLSITAYNVLDQASQGLRQYVLIIKNPDKKSINPTVFLVDSTWNSKNNGTQLSNKIITLAGSDFTMVTFLESSLLQQTKSVKFFAMYNGKLVSNIADIKARK